VIAVDGHPFTCIHLSFFRAEANFVLVVTLAKRCHACGEVKAVAEFYTDRHRCDGFTSKCRACSIAYAKRYYAANRERVLDRMAARRGGARRLSGGSATVVAERIGSSDLTGALDG